MVNAKTEKHIGLWKGDDEAASVSFSQRPVWTNSSKCIDLRIKLLELIQSAEKTLWIASPFIDDNRIIDALIGAKSRRVRIKVITDIRNNRGRGKQYLTRGFESRSREATKIGAHQESIRRMASHLISCRSPTHYPHFKLVVSDNQNALLSSANLTINSQGGNSDSSLEVGLSLDRHDQVDRLSRLLSVLWNSCPFRLILNEADVSIEHRGNGESIALQARDEKEHGFLVNSPGEEYFSLTNGIIEQIKASRREVLMVSMSFFDASEVPGLEEALLEALSRNVRITAIIRPEHFRKQEEQGEYPDTSTRKLIKSGMELRGIAGLHAKGMLIDQNVGLIFSANINPFSLTHGVESNHMELGIQLKAGDTGFDEWTLFMRELRIAATQRFTFC